MIRKESIEMRTSELSLRDLAIEPASSLIGPKLSYCLLTVTVLLLLLSHTWNQRWQADFWQHSAAVRELSLNPWSPEHPHLPVKAPHEFYSPYLLSLGLLSRVSGLNSIAVLSIMGMLNFVFFSWSLHRFCLKISGYQWCPFFTLLFTLVLWGYNPWMFSGFFHLAMLGDTAPYPSMVSGALTLLVWSVYIDFARGRKHPVRPVLLWLIMSIVLVSHPHTAVAMYVGLLTLWYGIPCNRRTYKGVILAGAVVASLGAAIVWPYYSLIQLVFECGAQHQAGNRWMYVHVVRNTFVGLAFVPCIVRLIRRNWRDPIGLMFVMLAGIYAFGYVSEKYAFGRSIVYIMFCLHFSAADWLVCIKTEKVSNQSRNLWHHLVTCVVTAIILIFTAGFLAAGVYRYRPGRGCTYSAYVFLPDYVDRDNITLTDLETSLFIPSFAGKVVANRSFQAFVHDNTERQETVNRFFAKDTTNSNREAILQKYRVDFILLNENKVDSQNLRDDICQLGHVVYSENHVHLIAVRAYNMPKKELSSDVKGHTAIGKRPGDSVE